MKIALFGGAFDPPHIGHKAVAEQLIEKNVVDEVWFVPVYIHPWAKSLNKEQMTQYKHRLEMTKLISDKTKVTVKEFKDVSFTFDTLEYFKKQNPKLEFAWVMGSEYLSRFDDFLIGHPGLIEYTFLIYPRYGYDLDTTYLKKNMVFLSQMPEVKAASTPIREMILGDVSLDDSRITSVVQPQVLEYIEKHNLYSKS